MDPTLRTLVIIALVILIIILIIWLVRGVFFVIGTIPIYNLPMPAIATGAINLIRI
jgi:hypothetical protein